MSPRSSSTSDPLKPQLLDALRAQLAQGERLAWAACPEPAAFESTTPGVGRWEAVAILGGGYMTLGACIAGVRTGQWLWLSVPIALLVCGILGYLVASRIKAQARSAVVGTVYGLTTRRALIMHTYPALTIQARPVDTITDVTIINNSGDFADLSLAAASASPGLIFRGVLGPERARAQLMRVIRDPQATDQELAASEAYALAMHQLMQRSGSRPS